MMINLLYNLLLIVLLPFILVYHCYRSISRGRRSALGERFGVIPQSELEKIRGKRVILVHAVSVGETIAALPLLRALREAYPDWHLAISNVTETGRSVALKSGVADLCIYFPFDFPFAVGKVLEQIGPELVVVMETEIWPNFIRKARGMGIPVLLANGRISDRSFRRYLRLAWFFGPVLRQLTALCMQTADDASRIKEIGALPETVNVAGNLKYDIPLHLMGRQDVAALKEAYLIPERVLVFTGASTHEGEEEQVIEAYRALVQQTPGCFLLLAPRHPERAAGVAELLRRSNLSFRLRSTLKPGDEKLKPGEVLLLDTVGELGKLFAASDLVFMGGSLVPTGGHNPLEPASCGVPVIFGPHMENFREIASLFLKYGAGVQVADAAGLQSTVVGLASDLTRRSEMGRNGVQLLREHSGATAHHIDAVAQALSGQEGTRRG